MRILKIGEKLRKLRVANDLTQEELAHRAGLSKGYISQLERDLTYPSIITLRDILDVLGTDLATFFKEDSGERVVFYKKDRQKIEGRGVEFLVAGSGRRIMEPVLVTLEDRVWIRAAFDIGWLWMQSREVDGYRFYLRIFE